MVPVSLLGKIGKKHQLKFFSWSCCAYYGLEGSMLQLFAGLFHPSSKNKCSVHLNKPWPIKALPPTSWNLCWGLNNKWLMGTDMTSRMIWTRGRPIAKNKNSLRRFPLYMCKYFCMSLACRRWKSWSRSLTLAAPRRSSVRRSWTAHVCSPASCPTSLRTSTGEASSGPPCPAPAEPGYDPTLIWRICSGGCS